MKTALLALLALAAPHAYAVSPREQLTALTVQLRKSPSDDALRLKLIALALTLKPAPEIPEEAREPFVMGATMLKKAEGAAGAVKSVDLFTKSLEIAPWFADSYYNRALAREAAGQFGLAIDDLKLYLKFKLPAAERRQAQDKIYALKANAELAAEKKGAQDAIDRVAADKAQAEQARRDVITQIKNAVKDRRYNSAMLSYDSGSGFGGLNQSEMNSGRFSLFGNYDWYNYTWKFVDDRVEITAPTNNGYDACFIRGESLGPKLSDMRWFGCGKNDPQMWAMFDAQTGQLFTGVMGATNRPLNDSEFDPSKRYNYTRFSPR
jgi:tetratricopeptide (TPR) repeat protein